MIPLFLVGVIALPAGCRAAYSEALAKKLVRLADASYCGDRHHGGIESIESWTCQPCKVNGTEVSQVRVFTNDSRSTFGFTGVVHGGAAGSWPELPSGAHAVISFRGSIDPINYADNGDQVLMPYPRAPSAGMVVRGFWNAYSSQRAAMLTNLTPLVGQPDMNGVIITGHSLGAGQAVLAALDLALALPNSVPITMYTFGTPRVGDANHAKRVRAAANLETWVVSHRADAEPRCPNLSTDETPRPDRNYSSCHVTGTDRRRQIGTGVWYPAGLAPAGPRGYIVCDGSGEDPKCEDGVDRSVLNWNDHCLYLSHSMWCCDDEDTTAKVGKGCAFPFPAPPNRAIPPHAIR